MALERKWEAVPPQSFTANGNQFGVVTIADTAGFKAKQTAYLVNTANDTLLVQVKRVLSPTKLVVGLVDNNLSTWKPLNITSWTVVSGAKIGAEEQDKNNIPPDDHYKAIYEADPTVADRVVFVDQYGRFYDDNNPLPIAFDGTISIGRVEVFGTNGNSIEPNADGSINVDITGGTIDTGVVDKSAFIYGTSIEQPAGGVFQDAAPTLVAGTTGAVRLTEYRAFHTNLRDSSGIEIDPRLIRALTAADVVTANIKDSTGNSLTSLLGSLNVNVTNFPATQVISGTVTANQGTTPWVVSGTITTSPDVNIHDSAGAAITLGQKPSATSVPVVLASDQSAIPVNAVQSGAWTTGRTWTLSSGTDSIASVQSGAWSVLTPSFPTTVDTNYGVVGASTLRSAAQIGNATGAALFGAGTTTAQVLRVVLPTDQTAIPVTQSTSPWVVSGTVTVNQGTSPWVTSRNWALTFAGDKVDASGSSVSISNFPATVAVTQSTSPWVVSGTVTANIGTTGGLALDTTLSTFSAKFNQDFGVSSGAIRVAAQLGNATGSAAFGAGTTTAQVLRVVLPTDQTAIPTSQSGTWTVQQGTPPWTIQGDSASGASKAGNPVQIGGVFNTTQPTVTTGQTVEAQSTARGALIVATGVDAFNINNVTGTVSLPTGAATSANQATEIASLASIDAGIPAALGQTTMAASMPVVIASNQSAIPISGTVTPATSGQTVFTSKLKVEPQLAAISVTNTVTYTTLYTYSGTGLLIGFNFEFSGSTIVLKIVVDGTTVMDGSDLAALSALAVTTHNASRIQNGTGIDLSANNLDFSFRRPVQFASSVVISARLSSGAAKNFTQGIVYIQKDT